MKQRPPVPEPGVREYAHGLAYQIAREKLQAMADIDAQCRRCGGSYLPEEKAVLIEHLKQTYRISLPGGEVSLAGSDKPVPLRDKILTLHYFIHARGTPLTGNLITYKELHEGINYYPTFFKRAISPVLENFKANPEKLVEVAALLGGTKADLGDASVTISAFPRVPITFVIWKGDEELAPEGSITFDSTIPDYLPTEDITILCEIIAWKLVRLLKTGGDHTG